MRPVTVTSRSAAIVLAVCCTVAPGAIFGDRPPSGRGTPAALSHTDGRPHDRLWAVLAAGLREQRAAVSQWVPVADSAAARFLNGGRLWVGGPFPDFDGETCNRAGGLMPIRPLRHVGRTPGDTLGAQDIILLGFHAPDRHGPMLVRKLREHNALIVGFGVKSAHAEAAAECHEWLEPAAPRLLAGAPAGAILTIAQLWAFNGEFIAACLRRGRMPTVWQSIMVPGSDERNALYRPLRAHADFLPPPVPAKSIAAAYLDTLHQYVQRFRTSEWTRLEQAGGQVRTARASGNEAYACPLGGHLRPNIMDLSGSATDLADVSRYIEAGELAAMLQPGDLVYIQGYTDPPNALLTAAEAAGAFTVLSLAGKQGKPPERGAADVVLDAHWELGDAAVPLDGYDVPLLPPSGFMAAAIYWALVLAAE